MIRTILTSSRRAAFAPALRVSRVAAWNQGSAIRQFHVSRCQLNEEAKATEEAPKEEATVEVVDEVAEAVKAEKKKFDTMLLKKNKEMEELKKLEKEQKAKDMEELKNKYMKKFDELLETNDKSMELLRTRSRNDVDAAKK